MAAGPAQDACRFVAQRPEPSASLPIDEAPEAVRRLIAAVLVSSAGGPMPPFEDLEATLRLRDLEAKAAQVVVEMRRAEARGDHGSVARLQREKMALDRESLENRRR